VTLTRASGVREWRVRYDTAGGPTDPYRVTFEYRDGRSGALLASHAEEVTYRGTVWHRAESTVTKDGETYAFAAGQAREYTHTYGDAASKYTIYYLSSADAGSVDVRIQYVDIADNNVLYSTSREATAAAPVHVTAPGSYMADGVRYVMMSGQSGTIRHEYYQPARVYTVFYRDSTVAEEDLPPVPSPTPTPGGEEIEDEPVPGEEEMPGEEEVPGEEEEPGGEEEPEVSPAPEEIEDEDTPQTQTPGGEPEEIDDESVPLDSGGQVQGPSAGLWIGIGAALLVAAAAVVMFAVKKRKKQ
jgi:hypothetical protein